MSSLVYSCSTYNESPLSDADYASEREELKGNQSEGPPAHFLSQKHEQGSAMADPRDRDKPIAKAQQQFPCWDLWTSVGFRIS